MSAGEFRRLVSIVIQSGHSVNCMLSTCTIEPEEEVKQLQVEMETHPALQMVALQAASADYTTQITLRDTTMSAGVFRHLVSIVIQSGHSVNCKLWGCTIEPEEEVRQLQVELENQPALQMVALQPVSADHTTHLTLLDTTVSTGVFRCLVSIVIQAGHSVNCMIFECTIKPEEDDMTMSAGVFKRLVSIVIQSGHSVNCQLLSCTIKPEEENRQLKVEMENQPALQMVALQHVSADHTTHLTLQDTTMSTGVFRCLVSIVIQSGHSVNCMLFECTIKPEEDVKQLQVEMENHPAVKLLTPFRLDVRNKWFIAFHVNVKGSERAKVTRFQRVRRFFKNFTCKK
ncbi:hypothetical protein MAR_033641 [Mya arenaria]|uniref:Uncharacterized protein n=1 Tax=Mya arenaria TaxID=6604 RepID=A0ABY7GC68_MYAAR|nr:hypothetical protein MAR_033641 [Mya arenaria]